MLLGIEAESHTPRVSSFALRYSFGLGRVVTKRVPRWLCEVLRKPSFDHPGLELEASDMFAAELRDGSGFAQLVGELVCAVPEQASGPTAIREDNDAIGLGRARPRNLHVTNAMFSQQRKYRGFDVPVSVGILVAGVRGDDNQFVE